MSTFYFKDFNQSEIWNLSTPAFNKHGFKATWKISRKFHQNIMRGNYLKFGFNNKYQY